MPRVRLTKSVSDALPSSSKDVVYWDVGSPGFGVKVTPKGSKVFIVEFGLYPRDRDQDCAPAPRSDHDRHQATLCKPPSDSMGSTSAAGRGGLNR
jgi:hypothetical protein